jgi:hypothetical protein
MPGQSRERSGNKKSRSRFVLKHMKHLWFQGSKKPALVGRV